MPRNPTSAGRRPQPHPRPHPTHPPLTTTAAGAARHHRPPAYVTPELPPASHHHHHPKPRPFTLRSAAQAMMMPLTRRRLLATLLCLCALPSPARSQNASATPAPASVEGFNCSANGTYPCQAYALYRAGFAGVPLDLAAVGDLFGVSRFMLAHANNLSTSAAPAAGQPLLVPLQCGCPSGSPNAYAPTQYQISSGDTFWIVSVTKLQNLTQYQAVERVNPTVVPTKLEVGDMVTFPIFCQCPTAAQNATALVTYVMQQGDTYASIAAAFAVDAQSLVSLNGPERGTQLFSEILVPLRRKVPQWLPPIVTRNDVPATPPSPPPTATPGPSDVADNRGGVVTGLAVGLGVVGGLWLLQLLLLGCLWRRLKATGRRGDAVASGEGGEGGRSGKSASGSGGVGGERFLVSDISEWLDKYRVFKVEELERGTDGFDDAHLIQGSVYKANIGGEVFAVKKMKWDACEELKILQKVNHSNLVKLEGFCINTATGDCFLVYEYVENGSLDLCLLDRPRARRLDWRTRLHIALDLAHGLQYIHEHTWPRVVHKDVKSSNVLLDARMRAKIANFGLAKTGHNAVTTHIVGTQGYIAPEYLVDGLVTTKMDVFAYGVVLLELVSGREAAGDGGELLLADAEERVFRGREDRLEARAAAWMDPVLADQNCPPGSVATVMGVARACLQRDPAKRPSMVDVAYTLSRADEYFADYSGESVSVDGSGEIAAR
ncbi:serine/threonine receptor-like kinase NFP [Triticum urartu]|nr:serine/threonine receptor-like kinase NFP [Triticum urartu]XP_048535356.1 serine/threonine receptor-like kinase NFP [Triticum urartu]